jgi:hypothetical protein
MPFVGIQTFQEVSRHSLWGTGKGSTVPERGKIGFSSGKPPLGA